MSLNSKKTVCIFLSLFLYVLALILPAAVIPDFETGVSNRSNGLSLLLSGWMGLIRFQPAWIANPLYVITLLTYGSKGCSSFGYAALLLALFSPFVIVTHLLIGFYVWIASIIVLIYGARLHQYPLNGNMN